jgi:hypothetical protein
MINILKENQMIYIGFILNNEGEWFVMATRLSTRRQQLV